MNGLTVGGEGSHNSNDVPTKKNTKAHKPKEIIKCIYCMRKNCAGCPLPFEDKITLRNFLLKSKASTVSSYFFFNDDIAQDKISANKAKMFSKPDKVNSKSKKAKTKGKPESIDDLQDENLDLELIVQFNKNYCWGLYELLIRG